MSLVEVGPGVAARRRCLKKLDTLVASSDMCRLSQAHHMYATR